MKGPVLAASLLVPAALLASACAATSRPPAMPEWAPAESALVAASAPFAPDDERMRVPRQEEPEDLWPAQGLYVGAEFITAQPLGDFDDSRQLFGPTDEIDVPDLDAGAGLGVYLSYRWRMNEIVLEGSVTEHDGDHDDDVTPANSRSIDTRLLSLDLNWRHYFWEHSPLQPFGLLGIGMSRAELEDGALDGLGAVHDAELKDGININVGVGAALYTLPWVTFFGQALYRFNRFVTSDGPDGEFENSPDIDGDTFCLSFGAAFRLLPPRN